MWHLVTSLTILLSINCLELTHRPRMIQTREHSLCAVSLHQHTYTFHQEPQSRHVPTVLNKSQ